MTCRDQVSSGSGKSSAGRARQRRNAGHIEPPALPTSIVHGWHDDVVPVENSIRFAKASSAELHILDGGHRLTDQIDAINRLLTGFIVKLTGSEP